MSSKLNQYPNEIEILPQYITCKESKNIIQAVWHSIVIHIPTHAELYVSCDVRQIEALRETISKKITAPPTSTRQKKSYLDVGRTRTYAPEGN
jgi:hypothetical protein